MNFTIPGVLSEEEVLQFREHLDKASWSSGAATAGTLARSVKNNLQLVDNEEPATGLRNHLLRKLADNALFTTLAIPKYIYPPKFNCYKNGGSYGAHIDSSLMHVPHTTLSIRTDLSATLFLSEPDEYEGGELCIMDGQSQCLIKLPAGDMIVYPANSLHKVNPVTGGVRMASFFWIQSMIRDDQYRRLLFELDQSVQNLTVALGGKNVEVVRLSGLYHNLVRSWSDP